MPRIAALTPFTAAEEEATNSTALVSEGEEDFVSKPMPDQIKRRLSGVTHPTKKTPAWQNLTVSSKS